MIIHKKIDEDNDIAFCKKNFSAKVDYLGKKFFF